MTKKTKLKSTRVDCGVYRYYGRDCEIAESLFGTPGTGPGRKWFYRLYDNPDWSRNSADMRLVLYFRNSADATYFLLKKPVDQEIA